MRTICTPIGLLLILAFGIAPLCHAEQDWRALDPENTLVIDTSKGRLIIEMRPDMAPKSVERVKMLAREKVYDGLQFHRVIKNYVAQTGNPNNMDNGKTDYPNLAPEISFKHHFNSAEIRASTATDFASSFFGSVPVQSVSVSADRKSLRGWGTHCAGVMGMGRDTPLDSANSEIYFMLAAGRDLDNNYAVVGRVVVGMPVLLTIKQGVPPSNPDVMQSVRLLSDLPVTERPKVSIMTGAALRKVIDKIREERGADFSICDVTIPVKIDQF